MTALKSKNIELELLLPTVEHHSSNATGTVSINVINRSGRSINLNFNSSKVIDLVLNDKNQAEVYRLSMTKMYMQALQSFTVESGATHQLSDTYELSDKEGYPLEEGEYQAIAFITGIIAIDGEEFSGEEHKLTSKINILE